MVGSRAARSKAACDDGVELPSRWSAARQLAVKRLSLLQSGRQQIGLNFLEVVGSKAVGSKAVELAAEWTVAVL